MVVLSKKLKYIFMVIGTISLMPQIVFSGVIELSGEFSYSRKNYSDKSYSRNTTWTLGVGYHFSEHASVELSYTSALDKTVVDSFHTTYTDDQIIAAGWVQQLLGKESIARPFFKVGLAQVNRKLERRYDQGLLLTVTETSISGYLALGVRVAITDRIGLTMQGVSYLSGLKFGTWKDNLTARVGLSYYF